MLILVAVVSKVNWLACTRLVLLKQQRELGGGDGSGEGGNSHSREQIAALALLSVLASLVRVDWWLGLEAG